MWAIDCLVPLLNVYINALFSMLSNFTWLVAEKVEESKQLEYLIVFFFSKSKLQFLS